MNDLPASLDSVFYKEKGYSKLNEFLKEDQASKIFILVDSNTHQYCLSKFLQKIQSEFQTEVIEIEAGEEFKNLQTCEGVWNALSELEADRKSLLINLGGGVVTDLGGFVASTFKRGIKFINIPTSLLSMVDASVGGKTGVDLGNLKNQIGVINQPEMVLIDSFYAFKAALLDFVRGIVNRDVRTDPDFVRQVVRIIECGKSDQTLNGD